MGFGSWRFLPPGKGEGTMRARIVPSFPQQLASVGALFEENARLSRAVESLAEALLVVDIESPT